MLADSLRYGVDILWMDAGEDLIALVEVHAGIAIVRENRPKLEITWNGESEFVDSAFEDFHRNPGGEEIDGLRDGAREADFFGSEREEEFSRGMGMLLADLQFESAFETASQHAGVRAEDLRFDNICVADEGGYESGGGFVVNLVHCPDLLDFSGVDHRHTVTHGEGLLLIVGHINEGDAEFFLKLLEFHPHLGSQLGVEGAQRFVEEENLRFADDGAGQGDALALATGKLSRLAGDEIAQRGHLHDAFDTTCDIRRRDAFHTEAEGDVFVNCEMREEGVILKNLIHIAPIGWIECDILSVDNNPT